MTSPRNDVGSLGAVAQAAIEDGHVRGIEAHGELGLDARSFRAAVVLGVVARRQARGLPVDAGALDDVVPRLFLADVYLTASCDAGSDLAWGRLRAEYGRRLSGLDRARAGAGARRDSGGDVDELWSDLALPPERHVSRTRIGTFDGSGPLWAWLAAVWVRRAMRQADPRAKTSGIVFDDRADDGNESDARLLDGEASDRLGRALDVGWARLEPAERCAVVWKHRHALSQRRIAALLGLREDNVSRLVARALEKLRGAIRSAMPDATGLDDDARVPALLARLTEHLVHADTEPLPSRPSGSYP